MSEIPYDGQQHDIRVTDYEPVKVRIVGDDRVEERAAVFWSTRRYLAAGTDGTVVQPQKILGDNRLRRRALIAVKTNDGYIGASAEEARSTGYQMTTSSSSRQVEIKHTEEVWFISTNAAGSEVTVLEESWAN